MAERGADIVRRLDAEIAGAAQEASDSSPAGRAMRSLQSLLEDVRAEILRLRSAPEADAMRDLLTEMADDLAGCTEGSPEEVRLKRIADVLDAYEAKRGGADIAGGSDVGNG